MLTPEAFFAWCERLQLVPETQALITSIRTSAPVRRVKGRADNVTGRYPSPKMQTTIQFESQHVELWAIYAMERDETVLEYYDQASRIPLRYQAKSGRQTTQWHTPDFFVLRTDSAGWEEWKAASALDDLAQAMPGRYRKGENGPWQCPPGEAYAQRYHLTYRLRSSAEFHALTIQNLKFLQDFWAHEVPSSAEQEALVLAHIGAHPGLRLSELLGTYPELSVDVVWTLLAGRRLFTDLSAALLMRHDLVRLHTEEAQALPSAGRAALVAEPRPADMLAWDGRLWRAEALGALVQLHPEVGEPLLLSSAAYERLRSEGTLRLVSEASPSPILPEIREALLRASPSAQQDANRRLADMLAYARGEPTSASPRSVQRWWTAYQAAEARLGCGYLGLLGQSAKQGNRTLRIAPASRELLDAFLESQHKGQPAKQAATVYRLYRQACEQQGFPPASERTFYRAVAAAHTPDTTASRRGKRAAYQEQAFYWWLEQMTPRHGERPFALAHLDHTELDIELVSSTTGKVLGRPWASFLTDAYSRRLLACYLTYDPPSYRSAMMVFRRCVQRHQRLPQELVVDRGPDFGSVYFETLLSRYFIAKKDRPAAKARFGSVIERLFGASNTEFVNQLLGNTQAVRQPRQMTPEVDPERLAVWTLARFSARLEQWAYEVHDQMDHPALGQSPREAFAQGLQLAGLRTHRLIPYSEDFVMLTRPTTRNGFAKVDPARGIVVNGLRYWHPLLQSPLLRGSSVPVRFEPFDMSVAYAFVDDQWLTCAADAFLQVQGRSEREWQLILDEWREQQRQHGRKRITVNAVLLGGFLEDVASEEAVLLQRQRDLESQPIREAILGRPRLAEIPSRPGDDDPLDLASIPHYEAY